MQFMLCDDPCTFYGTISTVSADNMASCALGGFKEGGIAYRFCRHCLVTSNTVRETVSKVCSM